MNVITFSHAYSLYPRATFHNRVSLSLLPQNRFDETVVYKYTARGWTFISTVPTPPPDTQAPAPARYVLDSDSELAPELAADLAAFRQELLLRAHPPVLRPNECTHCAHCTQRRADERSIARAFPASPRWIGDAHSWVLPLDMEGVDVPVVLPGPSARTPPALARDPCIVTSWRLADRRRRGDGLQQKKVEASVLALEGLWYAYVTCEPRLEQAIMAMRELYEDFPRSGGEQEEQ